MPTLYRPLHAHTTDVVAHHLDQTSKTPAQIAKVENEGALALAQKQLLVRLFQRVGRRPPIAHHWEFVRVQRSGKMPG